MQQVFESRDIFPLIFDHFNRKTIYNMSITNKYFYGLLDAEHKRNNVWKNGRVYRREKDEINFMERFIKIHTGVENIDDEYEVITFDVLNFGVEYFKQLTVPAFSCVDIKNAFKDFKPFFLYRFGSWGGYDEKINSDTWKCSSGSHYFMFVSFDRTYEINIYFDNKIKGVSFFNSEKIIQHKLCIIIGGLLSAIISYKIYHGGKIIEVIDPFKIEHFMELKNFLSDEFILIIHLILYHETDHFAILTKSLFENYKTTGKL